MKFKSNIFHTKHEPGLPIWKGNSRFMNPQRDWMIGFGIAALIFVSGISYIAFDFYQQFGVPAQPVIAEYAPVVYDEKDVIYFAELYEQKERRFNMFRAGAPAVPLAEN